MDDAWLPVDDTPLLLERLAALLQQSVREDAARHGLLPIHLQVLAYLARANRYSDRPIAVAEYFGITRGTVSQTLAVLERRGLVARQPDERDGKHLHLALTAAGRAVLARGWTRRLDAALRAAGAQADIGERLRALLTALQRQNGNRAFGVCRQCAHFLPAGDGHLCGLTGEPLAREQTRKICREWTAPEPAAA
ncbi:MAG: MarR family transcriptional regulator [Burkholderiales bacterium]|nr:MarR family transcriptional regulator [Burkholderiales bacterium]OJX05079.1 MAG: MarR family transcriptional regulator [Burkholderiales bacterium 70-64]